MKVAVDVGKWIWKLGFRELVPSDSIFVKRRGLLQTSAFALRAAVWTREALWIENSNGFAKVFACHAYGGNKIRIACDDDRRIVFAKETIHEQMRAEIYIGAFFLGFINLDGVGWRSNHLGTDNSRAKISLDDFEFWQSSQRAPVGLLAFGLVRITRQGSDFCGEEFGGDNLVPGKHGRGESQWIQPTEWRVLQRAVIEVEPVDVENGLHRNLLPEKNAGASPERDAPRPAAEACRRDVKYL